MRHDTFEDILADEDEPLNLSQNYVSFADIDHNNNKLAWNLQWQILGYRFKTSLTIGHVVNGPEHAHPALMQQQSYKISINNNLHVAATKLRKRLGSLK